MHSFFGDPCVSAIAMSVAPRQGIARCTWLFFGVGAPTAFLVRPNVRAEPTAKACVACPRKENRRLALEREREPAPLV